ncbi:hypothetical protein HD598_000380 [Neomicrococcus aestuarii]|uniref:Uncharacterized protein n=1 Tax=Neomicrococcus aestuarii TaxID=556325 RepID=A0A7W8TTF3_9MICC|nr:hypothetical protein [Neomicrococcus aestuarii]MBB5511693.1 hypothetical protein [Neomicrococcus aestuarii]
MTIQDRAVNFPVASRSVVYEGRVWNIVHDKFVFPDTVRLSAGTTLITPVPWRSWLLMSKTVSS